MIDWPRLLTGLAVALLIATLATLRFSLKDFSRRRLETVCRNAGRLQRFSELLRSADRLRLLLEGLLLIAVVLCVWNAAAAAEFVSFHWPQSSGWVAVVGWGTRLTAMLALLCLIFVVLPWTVARVRGEWLLYRAWPVLRIVQRVLLPASVTAGALDRLLHRVFAEPEPDPMASPRFTTDELLSVVDAGQREGAIAQKTSTMIHRVVDLHMDDVASIYDAADRYRHHSGGGQRQRSDSGGDSQRVFSRARHPRSRG